MQDLLHMSPAQQAEGFGLMTDWLLMRKADDDERVPQVSIM
jgi:hypothetical protein